MGTMTLPPKAVSTMCWIQSVVIVGSYLLACTFNKVFTKLTLEAFGADHHVSMPWMARGLIACGPFLLLVPFAWGAYSMITVEQDGDTMEIAEGQARLGYAITILLGAFCAISVWKAFLGAFIYPWETN